MSLRGPLSFVYGNCVHGTCGPWALFALEPYSYATLTAERKRERFSRLLTAIESLEADIQILRVARRWDPVSELAGLGADYAGPHTNAHVSYLAAQLKALADERAELPAVYLAVSLEPPQRDVATFLSEFGSRSTRDSWRAIGRAIRVGPSHHFSAVDREQRVSERLGRLRLCDHSSRAELDGGIDLLIGDRPRIDNDRPDARIVRQRVHPIDPVARVAVGVE